MSNKKWIFCANSILFICAAYVMYILLRPMLSSYTENESRNLSSTPENNFSSIDNNTSNFFINGIKKLDYSSLSLVILLGVIFSVILLIYFNKRDKSIKRKASKTDEYKNIKLLP